MVVDAHKVVATHKVVANFWKSWLIVPQPLFQNLSLGLKNLTCNLVKRAVAIMVSTLNIDDHILLVLVKNCMCVIKFYWLSSHVDRSYIKQRRQKKPGC